MKDPNYRSSIAPVIDDKAIIRMDATSLTTYYACAANQFLATPNFAIATPQGINLVYQDPEAWSSSSGVSWSSDGHDEKDFDWLYSPYGVSDTTAVDWLDRNVVLSGCRNGQVRLWDTRNIGTSIPLRHPSSITHARRLNENMIVVAGLKHQASPMIRLSSLISSSFPSPHSISFLSSHLLLWHKVLPRYTSNEWKLLANRASDYRILSKNAVVNEYKLTRI